MPGRELRRRYPADRTVRSGFVVITPPLADDHSSVCEIVEVVIVQAFVSKLAVEALDVGVLRGLAGSNQFQIDTLGISPAIERPAGELRALVGSNRLRQPAELADLGEHPRDILPRDAEIDCDIETLAGKVIDYRQAFDAPAVSERVHHKIHAPGLVGTGRLLQCLPIQHNQLPATTLPDTQARFAIEPIHFFMVSLYAFTAQKVVNTPVAEPAPGVRQVNHACLKHDILGRLLDQPAQRRARNPYQPTSAPLGDLHLLAALIHRLPLVLWAWRFT